MHTAILLGLLAVSMGLFALISAYFSRRTVEDLASRIMGQALLRTETRVHELTRAAVEQNQFNLLISDADQLSAERFESLFVPLAHAFTVRPELSYIGLGLEATGEYCMVERLPDGTPRIREYRVDPDGVRRIRDYRPTTTGRELIRTLPWDGYDVRNRPFYVAAKTAGKSVWTDVYMFWETARGQIPGLTFAAPVYGRSGDLVAVWDTDFDIMVLSGFLKRMQSEAPGYAFVVEEGSRGTRRVIAHPRSNLLLKPGSTDLLPDLQGFNDAPAQQLLARLPASVVLGKTGIHIFEFTAAGEEFLGGYARLSGAHSPPWLVAMVLPKYEVMGNVREHRRWDLLLFLLVLGAAALVALRVARLAAEPLGKLQQETEAIGRLDFTCSQTTPSRIREIDLLSTAVDQMKTNLRSFSKFVPAELVGDLVRSGREAALGAQTARVTIYFSDIANFTAAAEALTPMKLVEHLGDYLSAMSQGISQHNGTVDKFIGDAVMAFWNAPQLDPSHALDACCAALANQRRLRELREGWSAEGRPLFATRIGINTDEVVVGNIGSEERMNYTIIGDGVNLASRLEKLNKEFGTEIIISEATYAEVQGDVLARPLDEVSVRGKSGGVVCYELLALRSEATQEIHDLCAATVRAFELYRHEELQGAVAAYLRVLQIAPEDTVARIMYERCVARLRDGISYGAQDTSGRPLPRFNR